MNMYVYYQVSVAILLDSFISARGDVEEAKRGEQDPFFISDRSNSTSLSAFYHIDRIMTIVTVVTILTDGRDSSFVIFCRFTTI